MFTSMDESAGRKAVVRPRPTKLSGVVLIVMGAVFLLFSILPLRGLADHVLARFDRDEEAEVERMTARAADAAEMFIASGIAAVMNEFNGSDGGDPQTTE
jgi:hypothetical protein